HAVIEIRSTYSSDKLPIRYTSESRLCMLRGTRGRRAIARAAQIAAFAVFAAAVLSTVSLAADTGAANGRLVGGAGAGTIDGALTAAYRNNPQLNAQRAAPRPIDDQVPP